MHSFGHISKENNLREKSLEDVEMLKLAALIRQKSHVTIWNQIDCFISSYHTYLHVDEINLWDLVLGLKAKT